MRENRPKVVIIGAGPGGLAAAIQLSAAGFAVTVLERQNRIGGRTATLAADGFRFDIGPTFFLYPRVLEDIYRGVGRSLFKEMEMVRLDPQYRLLFGGGGQIDATACVEQMEREISSICPADAVHFRRFLSDNREKLERFRPCLESPFLSWKDVFSPHMLRLLPLLSPWRSLDRELSRYFSDARLRLAFSFQSKYLGMSPFRCPSLFSILAYLEYEAGVWHPVGGCGAVTANMAQIATDLGAEIRTSEPVQEVLFRGKRAVGVRTDQGTYPCDSIVVNADFAHAMQNLVPDHLRSRWTDRKISGKRFSCSTFMMYLGVDGLDHHLAHHNIYMAQDYERNLDDIEIRHVLSEDPSFYVQNACVTDPTLAPRGMSTLYVLLPVTHQSSNVDWSKETARYRQVALQQMEKIGINDVERRIRYEKIITPNHWEHDFGIYRGATFNLAHNLTQMLHLRPRNRFEDLEGVYLVGGGTHPGSGLPVIFESARISSRLLMEDFGMDAGKQAEPAMAAASRVA